MATTPGIIVLLDRHQLRESTAKMSVRRLSSLIDYISAWGAENNVKFTEPRQKTDPPYKIN